MKRNSVLRSVLQVVTSYVFIVWLAATFAFFAIRLLPGDAIEAKLALSAASPAAIAEQRALLGLNLPIAEQYLQFWVNLLRGDLGHSLTSGLPVTELIGNALPSTLELALSAFLVALITGLSLGVLSAATSAHISFLPSLLTNLLLSVPIYWTGTLMLFFFNAPSQSALFAPMLLLGLHTGAPIARVFSASLKQIRHAPYLFAARAKGLRARRLLLRHTLPLALLPTLNVIGLQAGFLLAGTVITEILFQRRGVGRLLLAATLEQDYPLVQGIVLLAAITYTLANSITALIQRLIDPRIETVS